jgi:hypothetical protein
MGVGGDGAWFVQHSGGGDGADDDQVTVGVHGPTYPICQRRRLLGREGGGPGTCRAAHAAAPRAQAGARCSLRPSAS